MQLKHLKMMIFQHISQFLQKHHGLTDGPTNQRTNIPIYRDVKIAYKNIELQQVA